MALARSRNFVSLSVFTCAASALAACSTGETGPGDGDATGSGSSHSGVDPLGSGNSGSSVGGTGVGTGGIGNSAGGAGTGSTAGNGSGGGAPLGPCDPYEWPAYDPQLDWELPGSDVDPNTLDVFQGCNSDLVAGTKTSGWWSFIWGHDRNP